MKKNMNFLLKIKKISIVFLILTFFIPLFSENKNATLLGEVKFYANCDIIKEESIPVLESIAKKILINEKIIVKIQGHTNSIGSPEEEHELSVKRAEKIAHFLKNKGVLEEKITQIIGFGGKELKVNKVSEVNRRVEIIPVINKAVKVMEKQPDKRYLDLNIVGKDNIGIIADVEIKKREKEKVVYSEIVQVSKKGTIELPEGDKIELIASAKGYLSKKVILENNEKLKRIVLDKLEKDKVFVVDNIYFNINNAFLKISSYDILDHIVKTMNENPDISIEVWGHTDNTGKNSNNNKLSEKRAKEVAKYIISKGIASDRLTSKGFGASSPIAANYTKAGKKKNRRTEFYIK